MMHLLAAIPLEIWRELEAFVSRRDFLRYLSTSKNIFQSIKKSVIRVTLDSQQTIRYLQDSDYRSFIHSRIASPEWQLSLTIEVLENYGSYSSQSFPAVNGLNVSCASGIHKIENWQQLFTQRKFLQVRNNITIACFPPSDYPPTVRLQMLPCLTDVSAFSNVKDLTIEGSNSVTDISCLKNLDRVHLIQCRGVTDIAALSSVKDVFLELCIGILDISALTDNHSLQIFVCPAIRIDSFRCFKVVHLHTDLPLTVVQLEQLRGARTVDLSSIRSEWPQIVPPTHCIPPSATSSLIKFNLSAEVRNCSERLQSVSLVSCHVTRLVGLTSVPHVLLEACSELEDIACLGGNKSVTIHNCGKIKSFASLRSVPRVALSSCPSFRESSDLSGAQSISVHSCGGLVEVSGFRSAREVEIADCPLASLEGLKEVPRLTLVSSDKSPAQPPPHSWQDLGGNKTIILSAVHYERLCALQESGEGAEWLASFDFCDSFLFVFGRKSSGSFVLTPSGQKSCEVVILVRSHPMDQLVE